MFVLTSSGSAVRLEKDARLVSVSSDGVAIVSEQPPVVVQSALGESPERFVIMVGSSGDVSTTPPLTAIGGQITGLNFRFSPGTVFTITLLSGQFCQLFFEEIPAEN